MAPLLLSHSVTYVTSLQMLSDYVFKCAPEGPVLTTLTPNETTTEIYLRLDQLDYSKDSKNGCRAIEKLWCP